jgi:hypothetical protein
MTSNVKQNEFKDKAPELFKKLRERVGRLKEPKGIVNEIVKLIDESESLLNNNPEASEKKYEEAISKAETVEISQGAVPLAWRLLKIEIGYLVLLLFLGYVTYKWPDFVLWEGLVEYPLQTAWFGALGGITIAIYGIYEHIHLRDFDPKYELWYICKPLMGGIFGWFVYLIYYIGIISVQGLDSAEIRHPELPYLIAFLAGFSERFTLRLIDRLMEVLTTWRENPPDSISKKETTK